MPWLIREWSRTYSLAHSSEMPWLNPCDDEPGVYRLIALRDVRTEEPMELKRLHGDDPTGTLCIGIAPHGLRNRLKRLTEQHQARGGVDARLAEAIGDALAPDRIGVCWSHTGDGAHALVAERALLGAYMAAFGERPPLNRIG